MVLELPEKTIERNMGDVNKMIGKGRGSLVTRLPGDKFFNDIILRLYFFIKRVFFPSKPVTILNYDQLDKLSNKTQKAYQKLRFQEWKNDTSIPINEFDISLDIDMGMTIQLDEHETKEYYQILNKKRQIAHELDEIISPEFKK